MIAFLRQNGRTLALAFMLSLAVWISAVTAADPDLEQAYPAEPIALIGQSPQLVLTSQSDDTLFLTLRAPQSIWEGPLRQEKAVEAWVDLTGLQAGTYTLPVQVRINAHPVRLISQRPQTLTLTLEDLINRSLPLHIAVVGEPAIGYEAGDATAETKIVTVSGPASQVNRVARVQARVNLSGSRESIDQLFALTPLDENNRPINGLSLNPSEVHISLPVTLRGGYRDVAVKVNVSGAPASGYRLTSISVLPPIVTVFSADPNLVDTLPSFVETQPLDLQNLTDDIETRLTLNLPAGVSVVGDQTVRVIVDIEPIQGSLTLDNLPVETDNLAEGLQATLSPQTVGIILSGPVPLLDKFRPQDLRLFVDLADLTAGTYQLDVQVELPNAELRAESLLPATVEVTIAAENTTP